MPSYPYYLRDAFAGRGNGHRSAAHLRTSYHRSTDSPHSRSRQENRKRVSRSADKSKSVYGPRTALATPLLREGVSIGAIFDSSTEVRPFTEKHIKLLKTFAEQAVIAIENVRLFKELQGSRWSIRPATTEVLRYHQPLAHGRPAGARCYRRERCTGLWSR